MDVKVDTSKTYSCKLCSKVYSSYKSIWNHNKKFHDSKSKPEVNISKPEVNKNQCKYCNNIYSCKQSRWRHEKTCKITEQSKIEILENTINEMKKQVALLLKEKGKIHHKTLQKINKQINNQLNNNGNIINNTYVKFGDVEYRNLLNEQQERQILNKQYQSLEESIKKIHFNEDIPEQSNIFITNMKDDLAYVFDGKEFVSTRKNEMINELIDVHLREINISLEKHRDELKEIYVKRLEKFLSDLDDNVTRFTDENNNKTYMNYREYKKNSVKLLIYNNSDKKKLDALNKMELKEKTYESEDQGEIEDI